jgi:hypothetical protein
MDLKAFVSQSIIDIIDGIVEAQEYANSKGGEIITQPSFNSAKLPPTGFLIINQPLGGSCLSNLIDFDIAVTAEEKLKTDSNASASFIKVVGATIHGQTDISSSTISRIKFSIPILFPCKK